jgi:hypothetical protein
MRAFLTVGPVLTLIVMGMVIVLRSGGERGGGLRAVANNVSSMLWRVLAYLAGLAIVQRMIGSPSVLDW